MGKFLVALAVCVGFFSCGGPKPRRCDAEAKQMGLYYCPEGINGPIRNCYDPKDMYYCVDIY